ncbi:MULTISPECIES: hypothetical protein [unclassified Janthinobacterium]|uniref:hypothetical protein n=1 Tax=unclassified Janthinobacterium TaxID=2610881 RepID=UPI000C703641|nr:MULTISPECIES: hypothetical protein [unclassified Janthinobacterium]PKV42960.1 hypothetical protein CLU92_0247 [Janthinobacterium sp. 61]TDY36731.1 hypothetical protein C8C89_4635 [Janthinobacterium sp. 75]
MFALPARHRRTLCLRLCLVAVLCGCTTPRTDLAQVRALAAGTDALNAFSELSQRHVDSYQRARPFLSPAEDARERLLDAQRHAAQADVARLTQAVRLYLQALGRLAQADAYDVQPELAGAGAAIRAWPGSGIDDRHVSAYTLLLQQLSRLGGAASQQAHLAQVLHDGDAPLQALLAALDNLLLLYDKSGDNERDIVLGLLDVDIAYADTPQQRLLAVLAKNMQQSKAEEYRLIGLRHTLARRKLAALGREHAQLAAALTTTEARWTDR